MKFSEVLNKCFYLTKIKRCATGEVMPVKRGGRNGHAIEQQQTHSCHQQN